MTWHYQLMKHSDGSLAVHEYYTSAVFGDGWTKEPVSIIGDDVDDVKGVLQMILNDINKHGVKNYE